MPDNDDNKGNFNQSHDQDLNNIQKRVEQYSEYYYYSEQQSGIDNRTKMYLFRRILEYVRSGSVLEFGYVDGLFTDLLLTNGHDVTLVEGATSHILRAQEKYHGDSRVTIEQSLFETYSTSRRFDSVIAGDMLQFISDPISFLRCCADLLSPGGRLIVTTPNCRSLHRRVGAVLNESDPCEISPHERKTGTVRLYDAHSLRQVLAQCALHVETLNGCFLKPLSSKQMESWDTRLLDAFAAVNEDNAEMAWFLYAVCTREQSNE